MSLITKYKGYNTIRLIFISFDIPNDIINILIKIIKKFEVIFINNLINKSLKRKVNLIKTLLPVEGCAGISYSRRIVDSIREEEYLIGSIYNYYFGYNYYEMNSLSGWYACNISFLDL